MISTARQLKDLIRNLSREKSADAIREIFNEVELSSVMEELWKTYQKNYAYAADIPWHAIMKSIRTLYEMIYRERYKDE